MEPWLHELLGIPNNGLGVELACWSLFLVLSGLLVWRERRSGRSPAENPLAWIVALALAALGGLRLFGALTGDLYFGPNGLMIPNYGVAMALGFAVPLTAQIVRARRRGYGPLTTENSIDLGFWIIISGVVGARALSWFQSLPTELPICLAGGDCSTLTHFWRGGLVFYGGVVGSLFAGWLWCRSRGVDFMAAAAEVVPFVALGHAIGRVGCFLTGCCFGAVTVEPGAFAVQYPQGSAAFTSASHQATPAEMEQMFEHGHSLPMHATQLYEAFGNLLLFIGLLWLAKRLSPRRLVGTWLVAYGLMRFALEAIRGDSIRGFLFEWTNAGLASVLNVAPETPLLLSTSQTVALLLILDGVILFRKGRTMDPESSGSPEPPAPEPGDDGQG